MIRLVDERERALLIKKIEDYSGAPIELPDIDVGPVELPKPTLAGDDDVLRTVRLRFEPRDVPPVWADRFNRDVGGRHWPPGLPIPRLENDRIEGCVGIDDVPGYVQALRRYVWSTNRIVKREQPIVEALREDPEAEARRFDLELEEMQRYLDKEFAASADAAARAA